MVRIKIKLHNQDHQTLTLKVGKRYLFGRRKDCDFVFQNFPGLSRAHFCLDLTSKPYKIEVIDGSRPLMNVDQEIRQLDLEQATALELDPYTFVFELTEKPIDHNTLIEQPALQPHFDDITQVQASKSLTPYILLKGTPQERAIKLVGAHWIAGREETCDIVIEHGRSSRQQFELFSKEDRFYIRDLNSSHGTYVMGQKISSVTPHELKSGDVIDIEGFGLIFELRDPSFDKLPLPSESTFSSLKGLIPQHWIPPKLRGSSEESSVVVLEERTFSKKKKLQIGAAVLVLVVLFIVTSESPENSGRGPSSQSESMSEFDKLSPEQQDMVRYSFRLADNLIKQQKFELAQEQLKNVHKLVPEYENSRELERVAIQYGQIRDQQNYLEQQRRRQNAVNAKVREIMASCAEVAERATTLAEIELCLQPAVPLNPSHPDHARLTGIVLDRIQLREQAEQERARHQARVSQGAQLFQSAKNLEEKGRLLEAIKAYKKHIQSNFPDPQGLKAQSQKLSRELERQLETQKESLMQEARSLASSGALGGGIMSAKKATEYAPDDADIAVFIDEQSVELNRKLKGIYTESVLEERFGNIDAAKSKWETILKLDLPGGEYAGRAQSKLKQYGGK